MGARWGDGHAVLASAAMHCRCWGGCSDGTLCWCAEAVLACGSHQPHIPLNSPTTRLPKQACTGVVKGGRAGVWWQQLHAQPCRPTTRLHRRACTGGPHDPGLTAVQVGKGGISCAAVVDAALPGSQVDEDHLPAVGPLR